MEQIRFDTSRFSDLNTAVGQARFHHMDPSAGTTAWSDYKGPSTGPRFGDDNYKPKPLAGKGISLGGTTPAPLTKQDVAPLGTPAPLGTAAPASLGTSTQTGTPLAMSTLDKPLPQPPGKKPGSTPADVSSLFGQRPEHEPLPTLNLGLGGNPFGLSLLEKIYGAGNG